ncbi:MAG: type II toxin-antitoxin system RelE/ParE family toxin [Burkholderiales bacterium]|nr:type II toxin-antitoxin system RelE/ParE family toxin [Burkholderiales bacterium]
MASSKVWTITVKQSVSKDLRTIPNADVRRILDRISALALNPRGDGCVKLSGQNRYRVRQGVYRIIYEIHDDRLVVIVVKVGHRSSIYETR